MTTAQTKRGSCYVCYHTFYPVLQDKRFFCKLHGNCTPIMVNDVGGKKKNYFIPQFSSKIKFSSHSHFFSGERQLVMDYILHFFLSLLYILYGSSTCFTVAAKVDPFHMQAQLLCLHGPVVAQTMTHNVQLLLPAAVVKVNRLALCIVQEIADRASSHCYRGEMSISLVYL